MPAEAGLSVAGCVWFEELSRILTDLPECIKRAEESITDAAALGADASVFKQSQVSFLQQQLFTGVSFTDRN